MPGLIRGAVAVGTFPVTLSTKFTEVHACLANWNELSDGTTLRRSQVTGGRRTWTLAKRLTIAEIAILWDFWNTVKNAAFYFYNPPETVPPFTRNPSGTSGRYLVRFASDWDQSTTILRSNASVELVQLASDTDMADASVLTNAGIPASGLMYAVTAHFPDPALTPSIGAELSLEPIGLFSPADWLQSTAQWNQRTDTKVFDSISWDGTALFGLNTNSNGGTSTGAGDQLWVYDCWCVITYGDGTTVTRRPTVATPLTNSNGGVTDPGNAIDGDPDTYAVVFRTAYTALSIGNYLALRGFA